MKINFVHISITLKVKSSQLVINHTTLNYENFYILNYPKIISYDFPYF